MYRLNLIDSWRQAMIDETFLSAALILAKEPLEVGDFVNLTGSPGEDVQLRIFIEFPQVSHRHVFVSFPQESQFGCSLCEN